MKQRLQQLDRGLNLTGRLRAQHENRGNGRPVGMNAAAMAVGTAGGEFHRQRDQGLRVGRPLRRDFDEDEPCEPVEGCR